MLEFKKIFFIDSNVQINCACHNRTFVMEQMTAATDPTRLLQFAPILIAIRFGASIVIITVACLGKVYLINMILSCNYSFINYNLL